MEREVGPMLSPIVVAVDGSEESLRAAEWAAREAQRRKAPLRIVAAPGLPPRMRAYEGSMLTVANALSGIAARALACAVDRVTEVAPALAIDTDLLDGPPALAVADSAAGAQLLVIGARGSGGFTALVLGSVSRYVASHASCPAVVVREDTAAARGARLLVVHAVSLPPTGMGASQAATAVVEHIAAEMTQRLGQAMEEWLGKYPEVDVRADVVRSHPAHLLASLSARADLVIVGRHGEPGRHGSSIQHAVLGHARGPVAIVPA